MKQLSGQQTSLPVLPFGLHNISKLAVEAALQVERRNDVGIGLADQKMVDIEHLTQTAHRQIFFK